MWMISDPSFPYPSGFEGLTSFSPRIDFFQIVAERRSVRADLGSS